jgi:hypothetical protein
MGVVTLEAVIGGGLAGLAATTLAVPLPADGGDADYRAQLPVA